MSGTLIGFYTKETFYEQEAKRLLKSVEKLGLAYELKVIADQGTWLKNTGLKASILLEFRKKFVGPLLYVDVDAYLHKNPWDYFNKTVYDIACHITDKGELLSGTIFMEDNKRVFKLLEEWSELCKKFPEIWDQKLLHQSIQQSSDINFQQLDQAFCYIFDSKNKIPLENIVIEHLQASREIKKVRKWTGFFTSSFYRRRDRLKAIDAKED